MMRSGADTGTDIGSLAPCLVIPHYDHAEALGRSLPALLGAGWPIFLVDDGSSPGERLRLEACVEDVAPLACATSTVSADGTLTLLRLPRNLGKGAAVLHGCAAARLAGFTHAVQIDADGQHDIADLPSMLALCAREPTAIVSGEPVFDDGAPAARVHGRKLTTAMIAIETLGGGIRDGLCGYRVYPLAAVETIAARFPIASRMGFDTDMLVKASWLGIPIRFVPTRVSYPADGRSHFHYLRDNLALIRLHLALLGGTLRRTPGLVRRRRLARARPRSGDRSGNRSGNRSGDGSGDGRT